MNPSSSENCSFCALKLKYLEKNLHLKFEPYLETFIQKKSISNSLAKRHSVINHIRGVQYSISEIKTLIPWTSEIHTFVKRKKR